MLPEPQIPSTPQSDDYPHQVRAFQVHASVYAATMVLIFAVNLFTNLAAGSAGQWSTWWSAWALIGWGSGIAVHGLVVFLERPPQLLVCTCSTSAAAERNACGANTR